MPLRTFFTAGFRPFFVAAAVWAALSMALWVATWAGLWPGFATKSPLDQHVHALIFGYGSAVLAGFLLTAIPNWTGRAPIAGWPLVGLFAVWSAARFADLGALPKVETAALNIGFLLLLGAIALRELLAAGNKRNLPIAGAIAILAAAAFLFHQDMAQGNSAAHGVGARLGLSVLIAMICLVGGRIIPAFTANWLKARGRTRLPIPFNRCDAVVLAVTVAALVGWSVAPFSPYVAAALLALALAHLWRLFRWAGMATFPEPLLLALHVGYGFVPIGFFLTGASVIWPLIPPAAGLHALGAGAIGTMTLTVMIRASLGHSGLKPIAGKVETAMVACVILAAVLRIIAALAGGGIGLMTLSATLWIAGFVLFVIRFGPLVFRQRQN